LNVAADDRVTPLPLQEFAVVAVIVTLVVGMKECWPNRNAKR